MFQTNPLIVRYSFAAVSQEALWVSACRGGIRFILPLHAMRGNILVFLGGLHPLSPLLSPLSIPLVLFYSNFAVLLSGPDMAWQVMGAGESVRIPSRLLLGIVPEVLLQSFHFWQYQVWCVEECG